MHPVRRCPGSADHQDLVMTSHLARSNPGPVYRVVKENELTLGNELGCADAREKERVMMRSNVKRLAKDWRPEQ
jgi:hypothetical protein